LLLDHSRAKSPRWLAVRHEHTRIERIVSPDSGIDDKRPCGARQLNDIHDARPPDAIESNGTMAPPVIVTTRAGMSPSNAGEDFVGAELFQLVGQFLAGRC